MQRYFLSKLGESILLLLGVMTLVFFIVRITGDPASLMASREASPETIEKILRATPRRQERLLVDLLKGD